MENQGGITEEEYLKLVELFKQQGLPPKLADIARFVSQKEGFRSLPYKLPGEEGYTVGFGSYEKTYPQVFRGRNFRKNPMTRDEALQLMTEYFNDDKLGGKHAKDLDLFNLPTNVAQAVGSYIYNHGAQGRDGLAQAFKAQGIEGIRNFLAQEVKRARPDLRSRRQEELDLVNKEPFDTQAIQAVPFATQSANPYAGRLEAPKGIAGGQAPAPTTPPSTRSFPGRTAAAPQQQPGATMTLPGTPYAQGYGEVYDAILADLVSPQGVGGNTAAIYEALQRMADRKSPNYGKTIPLEPQDQQLPDTSKWQVYSYEDEQAADDKRVADWKAAQQAPTTPAVEPLPPMQMPAPTELAEEQPTEEEEPDYTEEDNDDTDGAISVGSIDVPDLEEEKRRREEEGW